MTVIDTALPTQRARLLRGLLLADAILVIIMAGLWIFVDPQIVPPELKKYTELFGADAANSEKIGVTVTIAIFIIANLASIAGLWFFRRWARILYTLAFVVALFSQLFSNVDARSGISAFAQDLDTAVTGAVLLLVWFIVKDGFARHPVEGA